MHYNVLRKDQDINKTTIKQRMDDSKVQELQSIFPTIDREVIILYLFVNALSSPSFCSCFCCLVI